jgi:plastocyanin
MRSKLVNHRPEEAAIEGEKTMLKVLGLVLAAGSLVIFTACGGATAPNANQGNKGPNQNSNTPVQRASDEKASTNANTNTTPTSAPSPAETAPMTATVKNVGLTWKDGVSGTLVTTIKVGGTVTWTKAGNHTLARVAASADNGCGELEDSFNDEFENGNTVTKTFTKAGTFGYECGIHGGKPNCKTPPTSTGMAGVIKVVP